MAERADRIIEDSHNKNAYAYLRQVVDHMPAWLREGFSETVAQLGAEYNPEISYANLYTDFLTNLENEGLDAIETYLESPDHSEALREALTSEYHGWLNHIYENQSNILEDTYRRFKPELDARRLLDSRPEKIVKGSLKVYDTFDGHAHSPSSAGSTLGRFKATIASNFKPMLTTSIPSDRHYRYHATTPGLPTELRMGTQGQRHEDEARVSPLFKAWRKAQHTRVAAPEDSPIEHVYINLLGYDRSGYEGNKEKNLSLALHDLEHSDPNIAVITLPADKGMMNKKDYLSTTAEINPSVAYRDMLAIAKGTSDRDIKDFHISDRVKGLLYQGVGDRESIVLNRLLRRSFREMGVSLEEGAAPISKATQQAVWFHFTKFVFPNFIFDTLKPATFNMSCKDAIDRGGVASAYYNLCKSFESDTPMNRDEFEQGLHAAAALVKGRGLNHHYEILWNAVNQYVNANREELKADPTKHWLIHWRNDNAPHAIIKKGEVLTTAIQQNRQLLQIKQASLIAIEAIDRTPQQNAEIDMITRALDVISAVETHGRHNNVSGKRLLVEVVSETTKAALGEPVNAGKHQAMLTDLSKNRALHSVLGFFKAFIGVFTSFTKWGRSMVTRGVETMRNYRLDAAIRKDSITNHMTMFKNAKQAMTDLRVEGGHDDLAMEDIDADVGAPVGAI